MPGERWTVNVLTGSWDSAGTRASKQDTVEAPKSARKDMQHEERTSTGIHVIEHCIFHQYPSDAANMCFDLCPPLVIWTSTLISEIDRDGLPLPVHNLTPINIDGLARYLRSACRRQKYHHIRHILHSLPATERHDSSHLFVSPLLISLLHI